MSALKIKKTDGTWQEVPMLKGDPGLKGDSYVLTEQDKQDIADLIDIPEPLKYIKDDIANHGGVIEGYVDGTSAKPANSASGNYAHAEGYMTTASGRISHAEGYATIASGDRAHAEGTSTQATNADAHAEGNATTAGGKKAHAEGDGCLANGEASHSEGRLSETSGNYSHAEGMATKAQASSAHAEGSNTISKGVGAHSEGGYSIANGAYSHAEGQRTNTATNATASHSEGFYTIAGSQYQHVQGKFNVEDSNDTYAMIIGNGTGENARSNAFAVKWDGTFVLANGTEVTSSELEQAKNIFVLEVSSTNGQTFSTTTTWSELNQARLDGRRIVLLVKYPNDMNEIVNLFGWTLPANLAMFERTRGSRNNASLESIITECYDVMKDVNSDALIIIKTTISRRIAPVTTYSDGIMSSTDKQHLDTVYADYSSALTALGVI